MNLKDKIFIVYCPSCENVYSIEDSLENAKDMRWKHYWKSVENHVEEYDIIISEYNKQ